MSLLTARRFAPLLITQTLSALNDNLFKNALVVLILFQAAASSGAALVAAAGGVFILPYVLLSATAGQVADRLEASRAIRLVKGAEVALMALAAAGFWLNSVPLLFAVLFGLGVQAAMFSPMKFGLLPSQLRPAELVAGNGLMEAGTFLGILVGTLGGAALIALADGPTVVALTGLLVAGAGLAVAWFIPQTPARAPGLRIGKNIARETGALLAAARANRPVWLCILGLSWFWVIGATLLAELPILVRDVLGAPSTVFTLFLAMFTVGVGGGSVLCGKISHGAPSARLVPFAAFFLSVFLWDFGHMVSVSHDLASVGAILHDPRGWRMLADLLLLAACGGLYSVPLYAVMQDRADPSRMARTAAANNVVNAAAMALAAAATAGLALLKVSPTTILLVAAALNLLVIAGFVWNLPRETLKTVVRAYARTFHGITVTGLHNLPAEDVRAVLVVNHLSFADGVFVAAFLPGAPVFAVNTYTSKKWWARLFLAAVRIFPVDASNPSSIKAMVGAVRGGDRLVVFPEGRITTTGGLMKVYEGAGLVADHADALIVPVRIDGMQFTPLNRMGHRMPRRWFPRLSITVLPPVRVDIDPALHGSERRHAIGRMLEGVMETASFATSNLDRTLFSALLDARDRFGGKLPILEDTTRLPISYDRVVLGAAVLGRALAREAPLGGRIGVMLPNAAGAVVTFCGLQAFGRVPAMLNFSAGPKAMLSACAAAQVGTVVTSRAFVEGGKLEATIERMQATLKIIWLEDLRATFGIREKLRGWRDARAASRLPGACVSPDAPAAVLFTSGSEGTPKGVVLSHRNMLANIAQVVSVLDFSPADRVFNAMPMFHSFGLTGATLLPLLNGVRTFHYPSPLHYRIVPELIYDSDSTIAFGTDTFLSGWAKVAHPYDFYRMRYIVAGAERVRDETRRLYADKFGVRILEGYGATECAPVIAVNSPMHNRPGTAGRILPGIEYRLDRVEGIAEGGRLSVHGPNVMLGYLRASAPGVLEKLDGGWYDTGDICSVDADGFLRIVGRAKRFAKIAGEMVSMPAAEALASTVWPDAAHAVVAIPDGRKGEALVLLTTQPDATTAALLAQARAQGVPEIAVPRVVRVVDDLPRLGTGKIDFSEATRMATEERLAA